MIEYSAKLQAVVASRTGIAPVHLLDVQDTNGNFYYWSDRRIVAPAVVDAASMAGGAPATSPLYLPWIVSVPAWTSHRSQQTDTGTIVLQYLSGNVLQRDFDRIVRSSALEGAFFVYRYWSASAEEALRERHGTLSVADPDQTTAKLNCKAMLNPSSDPTPQYSLCEICPWRWGSAQCGSTAANECQHSFPTCQVPERILVISNNYEKNYGETIADLPARTMNRARKF
jgi:hypothetical protein